MPLKTAGRVSLFQQTMRRLLMNGDYSDMQIICQGVTFCVHRAIVCPQSPFFKAAMDGKFQESATQIVNLPEDDPKTITRVLQFLYILEYEEAGDLGNIQRSSPELENSLPPDSEESPAGDPTPDASGSKDESKPAKKSTADIHIQIYLAADKFGIVPLKSLAAERFADWANSNVDSPEFLDAVQDVMTLLPPHDSKLQEVVTGVITKNINKLIQDGTIITVLENFGSLSAAIIAQLVQSGKVLGPNEKADSALDLIVQKLSGRQYCRHCPAPLNVKMEDGEYQNGTFRCAKCSTRH